MNLSRFALLASLAGLVILLIGGPGYRFGLWDLSFGLMGALRYASYLGIAGCILALAFLAVPRFRKNNLWSLLIALIVGLGVIATPIQVRSIASNLPPIHDITTDTIDPPQFVAVIELRADAPNPPEYAGEETAGQQREAYPDISTLESPLPPGRMFDLALDVAQRQGWEIVATVPEEGRIEATATTFWYGFKDDVVIRIRPAGSGSQIDMRSKSRIGRSDLGANAQRIRNYLEDLREHSDI